MMKTKWSAQRTLRNSDRTRRPDLYQKSVHGVGYEELLLSSESNDSPLDWSPDGHWIIFACESPPKRKSDLWALEPLGDPRPVPIVQTPFDESDARFRPDGRWIAFV